MDHSENSTGNSGGGGGGGGGDTLGPHRQAGRHSLGGGDGVEHWGAVDLPFRHLRLAVIVLVVSCLVLAAFVWRRLLGDLP